MKLGIYRHHKGKMYRLIDFVRHSETLEELVLYETLYENQGGRLWVRPKSMFFEMIEKNGEAIPRFQLVSE